MNVASTRELCDEHADDPALRVIDGSVRNEAETAACAIGIHALAPHPLRCRQRGNGHRDVRVRIRQQPIAPGDWLAAGADGVIVLDNASVR